MGDRVLYVTGVRTARFVGDSRVGRKLRADGVFVVIDIKITTKDSPSLRLSDEGVKLEDGRGSIYERDPDATTAAQRAAAVGDEQRPPAFENDGALATLRNTFVFDIPEGVLRRGLRVRSQERGSPRTHGYIRLPAIPAR